MWSGLILGIALSLLLPGLVAAQQLYTCKTPEGRLVMRDTPCPAGSTEKVIERQEDRPQLTVPPKLPPRSSHRPKASRHASSPASTVLEPEVPLQACVNMNDVATEVVRRTSRRSDLKWKVDVSNRCKRPLQAMVVFGVYDRNDFEIQVTRRKLRVPAQESTTAQGRMSLPPGDIQRIASKKAEVYLP